MATAIIFIAAVVFIAVFIAILVARKRKPKFRISILLMFSGVAIALGGLSGFMRVMGQPEGNLGLSADMVI